jgi:carboxypeptidase family protein
MKRGLAVSRMLATLIVAAGVVVRVAGAQAPPSTVPTSAALHGVVRDSSGSPLANVEVVVRAAAVDARTDGRGEFTIVNLAPGSYDVWFRRLGYASIRYQWLARPGTSDVKITLHAVPHGLNPMIVRANEDKLVDATASIYGVVLDSAGAPVDDAEVQLVGADHTAMSRSNGQFLLTAVPTGEYALRVRKLGFAPLVLQLSIRPDEQHRVAVRLSRLAVMLDAVVVNEQSGFGESQAIWDELDHRLRLQTPQGAVLGPAELARFHSLPLDVASTFMLDDAAGLAAMRAAHPVSIVASGQAPSAPIEGDACILLNGSTALYEPLRLFAANDLRLVEIYPSGSELTRTVSARMDTKRDCRAQGLEHPTYYVLWLKGSR